MKDEDHLTIQLVITFIRNLLAISDPPPSEAKGGRRARMQVGWLCLVWGVSVGAGFCSAPNHGWLPILKRCTHLITASPSLLSPPNALPRLNHPSTPHQY